MKIKLLLLGAVVATAAGCGSEKEPAAQPQMPVSAVVAKAVQTPIKDKVQLVGSLVARDAISIVSELDSRMMAIPVKEGQRVAKGDKLFQLDHIITAARLAEAESAFKLAKLSHERNRELVKNKTISQQKFDESEADLMAKQARLDLAANEQSKSSITAPFAGIVGERTVSVGQFVTRGQILLNLVSTDPLDITGDIPERYSAGIKPGLTVEFTTTATMGKTFKATVVYVSPSIDTASRTVRIKAEVPNGDGQLRPGMFGHMSLILEERANALLIPESCIQMRGPAMLVVKVNSKGLTEFTPITTGIRAEGMVEITSGLTSGDRVVVEGWQKMGPGMPVNAAPESEAYGVTPGPLMESDNVDL